ncbi:MAG: aromatic-ring-hydroxylating dioxygenase subunit beta [Betaproteobacteria bacterium]|nr:aromatic-ring-hydroxylating dioxygenase subunit beta [Betaproteobacteria bacterium]
MTNALATVTALLADYCAHLDADRLEAWCGLFAGESSYRIVPRENRLQNLPAAILHLANRRMIQDRITVLRTAAVYNIHVDRHMLSAIRVLEADARAAKYEANFCVYQSDQEGRTRLFCTGFYAGEVSLAPQPLFIRQEVVVDTFSIPALLAVPI